MYGRVYRLGNKNASFSLAECQELNIFGDVIKSPRIGWLNIPTASKIAIHLVVKNAVDLLLTLSAKVSAVDPDDLAIQDLALTGVGYEGEIENINGNGEFIMDIVNTACPIINPTVTITNGSADFVIIIGGKE